MRVPLKSSKRICFSSIWIFGVSSLGFDFFQDFFFFGIGFVRLKLILRFRLSLWYRFRIRMPMIITASTFLQTGLWMPKGIREVLCLCRGDLTNKIDRRRP